MVANGEGSKHGGARRRISNGFPSSRPIDGGISDSTNSFVADKDILNGEVVTDCYSMSAFNHVVTATEDNLHLGGNLEVHENSVTKVPNGPTDGPDDVSDLHNGPAIMQDDPAVSIFQVQDGVKKETHQLSLQKQGSSTWKKNARLTSSSSSVPLERSSK